MENKLNLAQQAIRIYGSQSEGAMLDFLQENQESIDPEYHDGPGLMVMKDHTVVIQTGAMYEFNWVQWDGERYAPVRDTRPAIFSQNERPTPPLRDRGLLDWPTRETVWHRAMESVQDRAQTEADNTLDLPDEPILSQQESYSAAPGLSQAIDQAIARTIVPDNLSELLDQHADRCARATIWDLPEDHQQELANAVKAKADVL